MSGKGALLGRGSTLRSPRNEQAIHRIWQEQRAVPEVLRTQDGETYRVRFPGWPNRQAGPDFRGALLVNAGGAVLRGDVEIHRTGPEWYAHGHDRDPAYTGVVLHVVWEEPQKGFFVRSANGARVPTVSIGPSQHGGAFVVRQHVDPRPCVTRSRRPSPSFIGAALDREGDGRLEEKAARFAGDMEAFGPDQALYRALLGALGYSRNEQPFRRLAERMPCATVESIIARHPAKIAVAVAQAVLFGAAGLLPSQRRIDIPEDATPQTLEYLWRRLALRLSGPPPEWTAWGFRPENAPPRRVAAAAEILAGCRSSGLLKSLRQRLEHGDLNAGRAALSLVLAPPSTGYWAVHWDFGKAKPRPSALLGPSRAGDIILNVAVPFFLAYARWENNRPLEERCVALYQDHPRLSANRILTTMQKMLLHGRSAGVADSARRQQGLIGLYKRRCHRLLCDGCAFGGDG